MPTFTTTDGCDLAYRVSGPASATRTLVLLHGWSQSRAMFDRLIPLLAEQHRVVSHDQRGHGDSGKPEHGVISHVNGAAAAAGVVTGMSVQVAFAHLLGVPDAR